MTKQARKRCTVLLSAPGHVGLFVLEHIVLSDACIYYSITLILTCITLLSTEIVFEARKKS